MATTNPYPQAPRFTSNHGGGLPPLSTAASNAIAQRGTPATLNLDDIFGDCFFTPDGETVFLSDETDRNEFIASTENNTAYIASRATDNGGMMPLPQAGGIDTTNLNNPGQPALVMGNAPQALPQIAALGAKAQQDHHMGYISTLNGQGMAAQMSGAAVSAASAAAKDSKKRRTRPGQDRKMSEQQKTERR